MIVPDPKKNLQPSRISIIREEPATAGELSTRTCLAALYFLQDWECIKYNTHKVYGPGYFLKPERIDGHIKGINNHTRKTAMYHLEERRCTACSGEVSRRTEGDHI